MAVEVVEMAIAGVAGATVYKENAPIAAPA